MANVNEGQKHALPGDQGRGGGEWVWQTQIREDETMQTHYTCLTVGAQECLEMRRGVSMANMNEDRQKNAQTGNEERKGGRCKYSKDGRGMN